MGCTDGAILLMQILMGLSELGQLQHMEMLVAVAPLQMMGLARARQAFFCQVEVWEGSVCVFRSPRTWDAANPRALRPDRSFRPS